MTYPGNHLHLTFGGTLPGSELWQCGLRYRPVGSGTGSWQNKIDAIDLPYLSTHLMSMFADVRMIFSVQQVLRWVKLAGIGPDGHYATEPKVYELSPGQGGAQTSGVIMPNQVSLVVSLRSGLTIGKANKGRYYLPGPGLGVGTDGRWPAGQLNDWLSCQLQMLRALEGDVSTELQDFKFAIISSLGAGTWNDVAEVAVGQVPDTQRRRRNALAEAYQASNFAA